MIYICKSFLKISIYKNSHGHFPLFFCFKQHSSFSFLNNPYKIRRTIVFISLPNVMIEFIYQKSFDILLVKGTELVPIHDHIDFCGLRMFAEVPWTMGPFFMKQIQCLEESAESLRERSLKFYKGCRKYTYVYLKSDFLHSINANFVYFK